MKNIILLLAIISVQIASGQIIPSSCTAPDSIIAKYKDDADRLTLRRIYRNQLTYIDSIKIPQTLSDTILDALIAVYNATSLPARDTVITMFDTHTYPDIVLDSFYIEADSNLSWMQQLRNGNLITGNPTIDNLISTYNLTISSYDDSPFWPAHTVVFITDNNYNLTFLTSNLDTISGVWQSGPREVITGDGNDISDSVYTNHIELIYSFGWGDCLSGCIFRRYWKFNVDFNCSVEYVGSWGYPIPYTGISKNNFKFNSVSPNPFIETILVNGITTIYSYSITNILGQELMKGKSTTNSITNLNKLTSGLYLLTIQNENKIATFKILKE